MAHHWTEGVKVTLIGAIGFTVTGSDLDVWIRVGIGLSTLAYGIAKAGTAWIEFLRKKNKEDETCD
jgi:hypothetical protein